MVDRVATTYSCYAQTCLPSSLCNGTCVYLVWNWVPLVISYPHLIYILSESCCVIAQLLRFIFALCCICYEPMPVELP